MVFKSAARLCMLLLLLNIIQNGIWPSVVFADNNLKRDKPQVWYGEEMDVKPLPEPSNKPQEKQSWLSKNKWWVALSVVLVVGAAAGGGGGGGSKSSADPLGASGDTGTYVSEW